MIDSQIKKILIIGANSDLAVDYLNHQLSIEKKENRAKKHWILLSKNKDNLNKLAKDLQIRYNAKIDCSATDVGDFSAQDKLHKKHPEVDGILLFAGVISAQPNQCEPIDAFKVMNTNYTACCRFINLYIEQFKKKKLGFIVIISSVAGDRGRYSNFVYGSSKAGLSAYAQGLRAWMNDDNVGVIDIKPGFTHTKMTKDLKMPSFLASYPKDVTLAIDRSIKKNQSPVYIKWYWKYIMLMIKVLPDFIFRRMKF